MGVEPLSAEAYMNPVLKIEFSDEIPSNTLL